MTTNKMPNYTSPRWSEKDTQLLRDNLERHNWDIHKLPLDPLVRRLNRTEGAIIKKAQRLGEAYANSYEWSREEQTDAFDFYIQGLSTKEIFEKIDTNATIEQLDQELTRLKEVWSDYIKRYAEERQLKVANKLSLDTIAYFYKNRNTISDFTRKAIHARIARG